jgi:flagellar FliL protein
MAGTTPESKKRRPVKAILLGGIAVLLVALVGVGVLIWQRGRAAEHSEAASAPSPAAGVVPLEPFLVNLADRQSQRFARVAVRLIVDTKAEAEAVAADPVRQARLRSALLETLSVQTADRLVTPEGKTDLKKAIAERGSSVLGQQVRDVLFTDFVVQ